MARQTICDLTTSIFRNRYNPTPQPTFDAAEGSFCSFFVPTFDTFGFASTFPPISKTMTRIKLYRLRQLPSLLVAIGSFVWLTPNDTAAQLTASQVKSTLDASPSESLREKQFAELADQADVLNAQYGLIKRIVSAVAPSVAHIEARKTDSSMRSGDRKSTSYVEEAGSGIILERDNRYYVITNYHVIENSTKEDIRIESGGKWFYPTRILHDRETDLSILFTGRDDLVGARFGNSLHCQIGDFVVAIGSPFGLSHSVSYGIISAKGRRDLELGPQGVLFQDFIQTDAAINPGNSGGPLINLRGEVVGVNTAIASNSGGSDGIGFSIPSNMALKVAADLIDHGRVRRGFLGVSLDARFTPMRAISLGMARPHGARVSAITPNSPAANSAIAVGDIVLEFGGITIANDSHLVTQVALTEVGKQVPVKVFRSGEIKVLQVTVGSRDSITNKESIDRIPPADHNVGFVVSNRRKLTSLTTSTEPRSIRTCLAPLL